MAFSSAGVQTPIPDSSGIDFVVGGGWFGLVKPVPSLQWHVEDKMGGMLTLLTLEGPAKDVALDLHKRVFVLKSC